MRTGGEFTGTLVENPSYPEGDRWPATGYFEQSDCDRDWYVNWTDEFDPQTMILPLGRS